MSAPLDIIRRPVRHARLRVSEDASIQLVIPERFDQAMIENLLRKKAKWIARHQQYFRDRVSVQRTVARSDIPLWGELFRFVSVPELGRKVIVDTATKEIRSGRDLTSKVHLSRWYRKFAKCNLTTRITELSAAHRMPYGRLFVRSQRTKWGTCSTKSNISLNWRLVLAPEYVRDYVILHELMHTKVLNHSQGFWVLLKGICPRCAEAIRWLNANPPPDE
jgi:predicted metal-dependent hydrolase